VAPRHVYPWVSRLVGLPASREPVLVAPDTPGAFLDAVPTKDGRVDVGPAKVLADVPRAVERCRREATTPPGLRLIGRRQRRSHNSWMNELPKLRRSDDRCRLAIHPDDAYRLDGRNSYGFALEPVSATRDLREGEQVHIGDLVFDVLHLPGHSEGSVCLYEERQALLLSGDVLFAGSYGRTDLPGGSEEQMVVSLARLGREIPPAVRVLPGHGPATTIGRERATNPYLLDVASPDSKLRGW